MSQTTMSWTVISESQCVLGESPRWDDRRHCLFWCDIDGREILALDAGGHVTRWPVHGDPGCLALADDGGLVVAVRDGIYHFDPDTMQWTLLVKAPYDVDEQRFNDGACDRQGRFWVGTMFEPRNRPGGLLYRLDAPTATSSAWRLEPQAGDLVTANGLAFAADGVSVRWADTRGHRIDRFTLDPGSGRLSQRQAWTRFAARSSDSAAPYGGRPDGAALDCQGGYWVAMYEGGRIVRLDENGNQTASIETPMMSPTMVTFGGPDLATLFVTSAQAGGQRADWSGPAVAGSLITMPAPVAGLGDCRVRMASA